MLNQQKLETGNKKRERSRSSPPPVSSPAFTLTEIMVVIVIIVLMLSMAMPVFRMMTGSRSEESAANQIAGMLGRARNEAIGLQLPRGIVFYTDASSGRTSMALVEPKANNLALWQLNAAVVPPIYPPAFPRGSYVTYNGGLWVSTNDLPAAAPTPPSTSNSDWCPADPNVVDQILDTDAEPLPAGIGVQLINDWGLATNKNGAPAATPASDAYVSTGAIMFDGQGRLTSTTPISIARRGIIGTAMNMASTSSFNYPEWGSGNTQVPPAYPYYKDIYHVLYPTYGLVVFQKEAFQSQGFDALDPTYSSSVTPKSGSYTSGTPSESTEEKWLDQNATPLLINRFNGTLIKGE